MICQNILEAVGNTPIVRLNRMPEKDSAEILVKVESLNVGGSIKTRTALNMIEQAEKEGLIDQNSIIVEPTSGNQGIGLALIGAVKGYRTIIIMPDSVSEERRKLVRHYGAEVKLIHDTGDIGKCMEECLNAALSMKKSNPNVFVPQQFENPNNTLAHKKHTALEIMAQAARPRHRRNTDGYRRSAEGAVSGYPNLGCGAGKRSDPGRRDNRHPSADGDRRRDYSRHPEPGNL